jgi:hypothetical protein
MARPSIWRCISVLHLMLLLRSRGRDEPSVMFQTRRSVVLIAPAVRPAAGQRSAPGYPFRYGGGKRSALAPLRRWMQCQTARPRAVRTVQTPSSGPEQHCHPRVWATGCSLHTRPPE